MYKKEKKKNPSTTRSVSILRLLAYRVDKPDLLEGEGYPVFSAGE